MRDLVYTFKDGRQVRTYAEATAIAKSENIPFKAEIVPQEKPYRGAWTGLKEKYHKYYAEKREV